MKIIGVCGSPRRGNTEWMLDTLMKSAARNGAETEILLLRKMDVRMCRGCLACEEGGEKRAGKCQINDDMNEIYPKLLAANAIVLASPGYMEMISGRLKNFLDRTCAVWPRLKGKKLAGLAVAEEGTGQTIPNIKHYGKLLKMQWAGSVKALAKNPGEIPQNSTVKRRLERLARKLVSEDQGGKP
jgi:multimeric flavodoxin WrbA